MPILLIQVGPALKFRRAESSASEIHLGRPIKDVSVEQKPGHVEPGEGASRKHRQDSAQLNYPGTDHRQLVA